MSVTILVMDIASIFTEGKKSNLNISEYNTKPRYVLMHNPHKNLGIKNLTPEQLQNQNFLELPNRNKLYEEYDILQSRLIQNGLEIVELLDLVGKDDRDLITRNPNAIFTRDPIVTFPWKKNYLLLGNMFLESRKSEPEITARALKNLRYTETLRVGNEIIEGGDFLPVMHQGKRVLLLGYGNRTTKEAALALSKKLIPRDLDLIFCLKNKENILHLDTAFSILPNNIILTAKGAYREGFLLDGSEVTTSIDPMKAAEEIGIKRYYVSQQEAVSQESCNMMPTGDGTYFGFNLDKDLERKIESDTGIEIESLDSIELAKGKGGVHCLTRPIY